VVQEKKQTPPECGLCDDIGMYRKEGEKAFTKCVCYRKKLIADKINTKVAGKVKFLDPHQLYDFEDTSFINISLVDFKGFLAGYVLAKADPTFEILFIQDYFNFCIDNAASRDLLKPDILVINFANIFSNKAAPWYLVQTCEERRLLGKKTWILSSLRPSDLEVGFKEGISVFKQFIATTSIKMFDGRKFIGGGLSGGKSWEGSL
jgi:hypothetical protein